MCQFQNNRLSLSILECYLVMIKRIVNVDLYRMLRECSFRSYKIGMRYEKHLI